MPTYTGPGHASIFTGTTPALHGIIANNWYSRDLKRLMYCTEDLTQKSVGSSSKNGMMSPANMLVTSVTDELRLSNHKQSKVIGIALKDRGAILPAGHTANAAYWFDNYNGSWISSTFYMNELPAWVNRFNDKKMSSKYIRTPWTSLLPIDQYTESISDDNPYEGLFSGEKKPIFPHVLHNERDTFEAVRFTPFGNTLTKDFAIEAITNEKLGKGNATDFVTISFSSTDYVGHRYGPSSVEVEDTYLRLDKDLSELLTFLDKEIGKDNILLFLTADHAAAEVPQYLIDQKIPSGYVDYNNILKEMRAMLQKKYGDSLISSFYNQQIFFDRSTLQKHMTELPMIQKELTNYLMMQKGVSSVVVADQLFTTTQPGGIYTYLQKGYNSQRSGDILVNYQPGYIELDYGKTGTTHGSPFSYDTHVPLLWYGSNVKPGEYNEPISITDIAPTLSLLLNISFPNGCTGKPIPALLK
jgi:predicted AlkP superfamily pyrophosphatase or phosphodiesterase